MANHTSLAPISHGYYIYERAKHTPHKRTRTPTRTACADTGTAFIYLDTDALALVLALVLVLAANCELQNLRAPLIDLKLNGWLATLAERTNFHLHFHCLSHSHTHCICNPNCYQQFAIPPPKTPLSSSVLRPMRSSSSDLFSFFPGDWQVSMGYTSASAPPRETII